MPLDPYVRRLLDMLAAAGMAEETALTPPLLRQSMLRLAQVADIRNIPVGGIEDRELPGPGGPLPFRLYTPAAADGESPGMIYFHGGAGICGSIETHDGLCRRLANASRCRVISVDYRLAPEHPFPAAVEDGCAATGWIFAHARELGIDPARIAIGGDSAGGTLATVTCLLARQRGGALPALQFLLCPVTDLRGDTPSRRAFGAGHFVELEMLEWAAGQYCPAETDPADPRLSPLRAADLSGLPPAHIHTAEFDPLRDEGMGYAERLSEAGVAVRYTCHPGMIHHFYGMTAAIPYARLAIEAMGGAIRTVLAHG